VVASAPVKSPVTTYARDIVAGRIVAGRLVRRACERHLSDLKTGKQRGLHFDNEAAQDAIDFYGYLQHVKGEWAGQTLRLEPWEEFIVGSLFGWMRADGTRRFRRGYEEVGRKNGKSLLVAGIGLKLAFFDNEAGADVYSAATKRDQAKIVWGAAKQMVERDPYLRSIIQVLVSNLNDPETSSKFEPLSADAKSMDGLNVHGALIDELHEHPTREVLDKLQTATGSRRQPLINSITTAGHDRNSVCWLEHDYGVKVVEGIIQDDSFFAYIATIDEDDDWTDPDCWIKANPNLGVSVKVDDLIRKCEHAKQVPGAQNAFKRLHLNIWTETAERWLDMDVWDENGETPVDPDELAGRECYAGLDLASTQDITALELYFPEDDGGGQVLSFFWVPEEGAQERAQRDRVPYPDWIRDGLIFATEGNVVDYDVIRAFINFLRDKYNIREIAIDRWNSTQLQTQLMGDGFTVIQFGQGYASMTAPCKEMERLVLERKLHHGGNEVLRWMISNVAVEQDSAGNIKISKKRSSEKVDGPVALAMAVGRAIVHGEDSEVGVMFV
jgi:phage terminase large subunit-like protein